MAININGKLENVNSNLRPVNGNLGHINGKLGPLVNQQFAVIIGNFLFFEEKENKLLFLYKVYIGFLG